MATDESVTETPAVVAPVLIRVDRLILELTIREMAWRQVGLDSNSLKSVLACRQSADVLEQLRRDLEDGSILPWLRGDP